MSWSLTGVKGLTTELRYKPVQHTYTIGNPY